MDFNACAQCGAEIESKGIHFRNKVFCSDECCEEFEAALVDRASPELDELADDDFEPEDLGEDLGYRTDEAEEELIDDDEFAIDPNDF